MAIVYGLSKKRRKASSQRHKNQLALFSLFALFVVALIDGIWQEWNENSETPSFIALSPSVLLLCTCSPFTLHDCLGVVSIETTTGSNKLRLDRSRSSFESRRKEAKSIETELKPNAKPELEEEREATNKRPKLHLFPWYGVWITYIPLQAKQTETKPAQ